MKSSGLSTQELDTVMHINNHGFKWYLLLCLHQWHISALVTVCVERRDDLPCYRVKHRKR